jgi:flagellin-like protein
MIKKRGLSPVIATVLLLAMVVVIGLIVFLWFRGMTQETVTKFGGQNIEMICDQVEFDASYSNGALYLSNIGNVPIFDIKMKVFKEGSYETQELTDFDGLNQGASFVSGDVSSEIGSASKIILTPVLIGNSEKGERTYKCSEQRYGQEIII